MSASLRFGDDLTALDLMIECEMVAHVLAMQSAELYSITNLLMLTHPCHVFPSCPDELS